jgi:hypothetical protein
MWVFCRQSCELECDTAPISALPAVVAKTEAINEFLDGGGI